jgi:hypothetical protein
MAHRLRNAARQVQAAPAVRARKRNKFHTYARINPEEDAAREVLAESFGLKPRRQRKRLVSAYDLDDPPLSV